MVRNANPTQQRNRQTRASRLSLDTLEDRVVPAFVINPTFAPNIVNDPNAATIEASINRVIAAYENTFTNNVTINITFQEGGGLGGSAPFFETVSYTSYLAAITANASSADDTTALASLPAGPNHPIAGTSSNTTINVSTALLRVLGLGGNSSPSDSTITLNTSLMNLDRTGPQDSGKNDLMAVVAHEMNESIGLGSGLDGSLNGDPISPLSIEPADLFRFASAGVRSFNTSLASTAFFSINGGVTNLAPFNQDQGGDFGDWDSSGGQPPRVQDAFALTGTTPNLDVELRRADVIGFTRAAPAALSLTPPANQSSAPGVSTAFDLGSVNSGNGPFGVTVNWGDGSSDTTFVVNSIGSLGTQNHTYAAAGSQTPTITITDFTSQTGSTSFDVAVGTFIAPTVTGVTSSTTDGTYGIGGVMSIQVGFSAPVTVTGTPTLALNSGGTASFSGGSGTDTLTFTYTVAAGQNSADLDYTSTTALALSGGTIKDVTNNSATLTLATPGAAGSLGANKSIVVDGTAPTASITTSPPALTTNADAAFTFTGNDPTTGGVSSGVNHLETSLDGAAFATSTSPVNFTGLAVGGHSFKVRAVDNAGNVGLASTFNWTIQLVAPTIDFTVGNIGGTVRVVDADTGTTLATVRPLDAGPAQYTGLVEVALGDFNGDGTADLAVAAAAPVGVNGLDASKAAKVFVYDGTTLATGVLTLIDTFTPFATHSGPDGISAAYTNGLNIAAGDVDGDGQVDLIAGTRGGNGTTSGLNEFGRLVVIDGSSPAGSNLVIGGIQTPFGPGYQKGVIVTAGNVDGSGGDEIAVTRGGPVASSDPAVQQIKVKVLQLQGGTLSELHLSADGSTAFAPFASLNGPANAINRDGRVAFVDTTGDGKAELVFSALDPLTNAANEQVRVAVYSINVGAAFAAATIVSTGPDAGTYLTGTAVVDHSITHVAASGASQNLALITESASTGIVYLAPLTGVVQNGGFGLSVLHGGITIDGI